jgi:hypothetical protein
MDKLTMTTAINVNETSERELTSDEPNTVSGGASARAVDQEPLHGFENVNAVLGAVFGVLTFLR